MPLVLLCAFLCTSAAAVKAASLFGKVIEVNSGDVITIFNLNRPVRIRLLGVHAPETGQAFADTAKQHLADLVFDKSVLVEYSGINSDHSLNGRVLLEGADIGAQMIRDGVAWVDPSNQHRLSENDREVYQQSENAARSERRGLWKQENPVAPWSISMRKPPAATATAVAPVERPAPDRTTPELTSLTLMASRLAGAAPLAKDDLPALPEGFLAPVDGGTWRLLRPQREHFSVLVPEEGDMQHLPIGDGKGDVHLYRARDGRASFAVIWLAGPTYGESDVDAIKVSTAGFLKSFGQGSAFACETLENEKDVSMRSFTGLEFDLSSCRAPIKVRVFTRTVNSERQMYIAMVLYMEQADNIDRFIDSFKITSPPASPQKRTKTQNK